MSFLRCYHTTLCCPKEPSDAWSIWCTLPIKCLFAQRLFLRQFQPLTHSPKRKIKEETSVWSLLEKTFYMTGTTLCLLTDLWVKLLWPGKDLNTSVHRSFLSSDGAPCCTPLHYADCQSPGGSSICSCLREQGNHLYDQRNYFPAKMSPDQW